MNQILIVEDDRKTANLIRLYLQQDGYLVQIAADGNEALDMAHSGQPDLILLDLMLPGLDGLEVCRVLRASGGKLSSVPIIILTARSTEDEVLRGLDLGADDYITKPFSPREVAARVRTVLRRVRKQETTGQPEINFGPLTVNLLRHEVRINDDIVHLTPKEFKLLETLAREPGRAFSRLELVERAFGYDYEGLERTVDAHIMNLRKKLARNDDDHNYVETVYGIGYRFSEPVENAV